MFTKYIYLLKKRIKNISCTYKKGNSFGRIDFIYVSKRYKTDVEKYTVNWKLKYRKKK